MSKSDFLQFSFLPYINVESDLIIGNIILWSFNKKHRRYVKNQLVRNTIRTFLKQHVEHSIKRKPVDATLVSYKNVHEFKPLSSTKINEMRNAIIFLCFSTVIKNRQWCSYSSDDFLLVHQNFRLGVDGIAPSSGSIVRRSSGGYKIKEVLFIKPFNISTGWKYNDRSYDKKLLNSYVNLNNGSDKELYKRIVTAIEWVCYAYTNADNFNYSTRIVMMATAFEILLDGFNNRFEFLEKVEKITCNTLDKQKRFRCKRLIWFKGKKENKEFSRIGWWAYEFYDLRSKIVHGNIVKSKDYFNSKKSAYFLISIKFFLECLKKILSDRKLYDYDFGDDLSWAAIRDEI